MKRTDLSSGTKRVLALLAMAAAGSAPSHAQTVTLTDVGNNLYNTGYAGTVLAGNNQADTHYQLIGGTAYQMNPLGGGYVANPVDAQWINPSPTSDYVAVRTFDYRLVLSNIPAGQLVTISGMVAVDDGLTIVANGSTPIFSNSNTVYTQANYTALSPFATTTFISGTTNTLDFLVNNIGGNSGLLLELNGFYAPLTGTTGLSFQLHPTNLNSNQQAIVEGINRVSAGGGANPGFSNLTTALAVLGLNGGNVGAALNQLSPEKLKIFSSIAFNNASFMTQDMDDYFAHRRSASGGFLANSGAIDTSGLTVSDPTIDSHLASVYSHLLAWSAPVSARGLMSDVANPLIAGPPDLAPSPKVDPWNVFVQGNVILGQDFSNEDLPHADTTSSAFAVGADYRFNQNFLMGVLFNYNHTDATLDNMGSSATVDSYTPGLYASYAQDGWYANALGTFSHNSNTEQRVISLPGFSGTVDGAPSGHQGLINLDGGYDFHTKSLTFGPTLGLQYAHLGVDSFGESGGAAGLAINEQSDDSLRSRLGGHVIYAARCGTLAYTPFLDASWQHESLDDARGITSSFDNTSTGQFTVFTPSPGRESALVSTGLNVDIDQAATVFTDYQVQISPDDYFGQSILAGVKLNF